MSSPKLATSQPIPVHEIVDAMLADIAFKAPVTVEDCASVFSALKEALPKATVEVYFHTGLPGDVVVVRADVITRKVKVS